MCLRSLNKVGRLACYKEEQCSHCCSSTNLEGDRESIHTVYSVYREQTEAKSINCV